MYIRSFTLLMLWLSIALTAQAQFNNITQVTLTFVPASGPTVMTSATSNGSSLVPDGTISLMESTPYVLTVSVQDSSSDITSTISDNGEQYRLFFEGDDHILDGQVSANDQDSEGLPVGISNNLVSACTGDMDANGILRLVLVDLGSNKSTSSTLNDGNTIFDINWEVTIVDDPQAPPCENEEEIITDIVLTWTPSSGGTPIIGRATDPDGEGPLDLSISGPINLDESTDYLLTIEVRNEIEGEDITEEIREEADDHMFFFAWSDEIFRSPSGNGNTDNRMDPVNYQDFDSSSLPIGLSTVWTTECIETNTSGSFQLVLKHQPDTKSASSSVETGGTDIDLTWTINIVDDPQAPPCENEEEIITDVILTWTPDNGGNPIVARAQDPDGEGPLDLSIDGAVNLDENTNYTLTIQVRNEIEGEDITEEIREEAESHLFFFAWTEGLFSNPTGDGNIDQRDDTVNYLDQDAFGLPLGLSTTWTTSAQNQSGTFRVMLKHQPDSKSAASTVEDGGTDIDLTWDINTVVTNTNQQMISNQALQVFPNPASDQLNWRLEGIMPHTAEVRIIDGLGRIIRHYTSVGTNIPVNDLPKGTYSLQIRAEQQIWIKSFVKW